VPAANIERWKAKIEKDAIDFAALIRDLQELDEEIKRREDAIQQERAQLDDLREDREALAGLRNFLAHGQPATEHVRRNTGKSGKRNAILRLLTEANGAMRIVDIRDSLVRRDVMTDDDADYHSLQVTLSRMYRQGELHRVTTGTYSLPLPERADQE
jgi:hypothetical protein